MMNYSDYDSDGYSSNEDADYVPSDDNLSEDDIKECEKEDPLHEDEDVPHPHLIGKKKKMENTRKKRKGVLKVNEQEEDGDGPKEAQQPQEEVEKSSEAHVDADNACQKEKSDKLWASFLSDVGTRPKDCTAGIQEDCSTVKPLSLSRHTEQPKPANVTITKVFDFAGEEIRVNKEVSADSKEAKSFLKSQSVKQAEHDDNVKKQSPTLPGPSSKRPAGMGSILSHIGGKKPKMSTLEKSKMDWDAFKSEEGITEELATHNRGREGYVERKKFLDRVDHRQFELEKAVRLSNMKQ